MWATFPGANGSIVYEWVGESAYRAGPTASSIRAVDPISGVVRVLRDCPLRFGPTSYTDCSVGSPRYSPDGQTIAFTTVRITPDFTGAPWQFDAGLATLEGTELSQVAPAWSSDADWSGEGRSRPSATATPTRPAAEEAVWTYSSRASAAPRAGSPTAADRARRGRRMGRKWHSYAAPARAGRASAWCDGMALACAASRGVAGALRGPRTGSGSRSSATATST